ncbi:MAG: hypothetical protein RQ847_09925 [Wenzhouxiangellaceae bacterium]|nr:hypothetical protein [Wenzhouxiangellaceae bacterium]
MSQLHFYVPDSIEAQLRERARQQGKSLSRYLADLVKQQARLEAEWPPGYFEQVFGQWQGAPLKREPQGEFERREDFS